MPKAPKADGTIKSVKGTLPGPTRPPAVAMMVEEGVQQDPGITREELERRQKKFGTKRRQTGPPLEGKPVPKGVAQAALEEAAPGPDVPPTNVTKADKLDLKVLLKKKPSGKRKK